MPRDFDYSSLNYEMREGIHNAMAATTVKHISANEGLFSPSEFNPGANHSHMLEEVHLEPVPTTRERVSGLAEIASPNLAPHAHDMFKRQQTMMSMARLLLSEGKNICVVTGPHGVISDVAIESEAYSAYLDESTWQDQNGLIISRGVTTIDAFGTAASQVVQEIGHVFMSFPRTKTMEEMIVDQQILSEEGFESLVATNNRNMRREARDWLGIDIKHKMDLTRVIGHNEPGKTLHQAWEGKTAVVDYGDNHKPERVEFQRVHPGILDITKHCLVLPVTIWDDASDPLLEIGELTTVKTETDITRVQNWQRETLANHLGLSNEAVSIAA